MLKLHIIRHADPDYERDTITDLGHREAAAVAVRMSGEGLTQVFTSPMGRARATARYTSERTGLEPVVLPWTAELQLEKITDLSGWQVAPWNIPGESVRAEPPDGTGDMWQPLRAFSAYDFDGRYRSLTSSSDDFLGSLGYRRRAEGYAFDDAGDQVVAVFCHAGFGMTWLAHLLALPVPAVWAGFFLAPTSVTTLMLESRSPGLAVPRAVTIGDTGHLQVAGLPPSLRGMPHQGRG